MVKGCFAWFAGIVCDITDNVVLQYAHDVKIDESWGKTGCELGVTRYHDRLLQTHRPNGVIEADAHELDLGTKGQPTELIREATR